MIEVEAKFSIPDRSYLEKLQRINELGPFRLRYPKRLQITDRYYDTETGDLRRSGYACRTRQMEQDSFLTLKTTGRFADGVHRREEVEIRLSSPSEPEKWPPSPVRDIIEKICNPQKLHEICVLKQERFHRLVYRGRRTVAELALDRVDAESPSGLGEFCELEVELRRGVTPQDFHALLEEVRRLGLDPEPRSKLEQALALIGSEKISQEPEPESSHTKKNKNRLSLQDTLSEAGVKIIRRQYKRLRKTESKTRTSGDMESLHQMRVATRRIRASLDLFGPYLPPAKVRETTKRAKTAARVLGRVRDLDVLLDGVQSYLRRLPDGESESRAIQPLVRYWRGARKKAWKELIRYLEGPEYQRFLKACESLVRGKKTVNRLPDGAGGFRTLLYAVPPLVLDRMESVRAFAPWIHQADHETYHRLRIECKYLRYSMEFFRKLLGPDATPLIEFVVRAQEHLGSLQDAVVAERSVDKALIKNNWKKTLPIESLRAVQRFLVFCRAKQKHQKETFPPVWEYLASKEYLRQVVDLLIGLE